MIIKLLFCILSNLISLLLIISVIPYLNVTIIRNIGIFLIFYILIGFVFCIIFNLILLIAIIVLRLFHQIFKFFNIIFLKNIYEYLENNFNNNNFIRPHWSFLSENMINKMYKIIN